MLPESPRAASSAGTEVLKPSGPRTGPSNVSLRVGGCVARSAAGSAAGTPPAGAATGRTIEEDGDPAGDLECSARAASSFEFDF
jgi:hypothetical protein